MPETIRRRITIIIFFLVLVITLLLMPLFTDSSDKPRSSEKTYSVPTLMLKLQDNDVFLFKNGQAVKQYDIDITLLPGEDINMLSTGITVNSEAEADMLAEDYDG